MITPQVSELDEAEVIELLRSHFHALYEQPMPRQVVVNLEYVAAPVRPRDRRAPGPPPPARSGRRRHADLPGAQPASWPSCTTSV